MKFLEIQTTDVDRKILVNTEHIVSIEPNHSGYTRLILTTKGIIQTLHSYNEILSGFDGVGKNELIIGLRCKALWTKEYADKYGDD